MVTRRDVIAGLAIGLANTATAAPMTRSLIPRPRPADFAKRNAPAAERLIAAAKLTGKVGFVVADARTGAVLETHNPLLRLPPASTTKALTALYALDNLGQDYRFTTRIVATEPVINGRLDGDLVLVGGGDPTLDTKRLAELASALKATGLREVTGAFQFYDGALPQLRQIDASQPDHVGYNPAISGLNLNFNRVHFEWRKASPGWTVTMDARAGNYKPQVDVARMKIVQRDYPIYTYADANGRDQWTVASGALGGDGARWLPVRKPGLYAAEVFQTLARSHGIVLRRPARRSGRPVGSVLAQVSSPPLTEVLRSMLKYSTNLTAEAVGLTSSAARGSVPGSLSASAKAMKDWAEPNLGVGRARFVDHSGLGAASHISASEMVKALQGQPPSAALRPLLKEVSMRGKDGKPIKNHPVKIHAKTGTLNFVSGLAGYVTPPNGRELVFAIFAADEPRRAKIPKEQAERPDGGRTWLSHARRMQLELIDRWSTVYTT